MDVPVLMLEECPLLEPSNSRLVDEFNRVNRLARELFQKYPALRTLLEEDSRALSDVRARLTRSHYRVGFLGTTGSGKSTTINNILTHEVVFSGKGGATTSAITRLRGSRDGRNTLHCRYLTPDEFKQKRHALCSAIDGIGPGMEDDEILGVLDTLAAEVDAGQRVGSLHDINTLRLLLKSQQAFGSYLRDPAREDDADYTKRDDVLNHPDTKGAKPQPSPNLLLREAIISFGTEVVPKNLELIDLPGLGSRGMIDSIVTRDFLQELDGAMVILRADQLSDQNAEVVLNHLKPIFEGRWGGRIWVICTKFDSLTPPHFDGQHTWFDAMKPFLEEHKIPAANVNIVSNKLYAQVLDTQDLPERAARVRATLDRPANDPVYSRYGEFQASIAGLYEDGGIRRLRDLLTRQLGAAVGAEIRLAAEDRLRKIERKMSRAAEYEERRQHQSDEEFNKAKRCRSAIFELVLELNGRPPYLDPPAQKLSKGLQESFVESFPDAMLEMSFDELEKEFPTTAQDLDRRLRHLIDREVIDPLYEVVTKRLAGLPSVPVGDAGSPQEAWQIFIDEDGKEDGGWRARFPTFHDDRLFALLKGTANGRKGFDGRAYRDVIRDKIRQVSNQVLHAVRVRLKYRLKLLESDLAALIRKDLPPTSGGG